MYCGHCGKHLPDGTEYCPKCGNPAGTSPRQQVRQTAYRRECVRRRKGRRIRKLVTFVVIVACLLGIGRLIAVWWVNQQADTGVAAGRSSYTALVSDYLDAAQAGDLETISALFFPGSEDYYQNSDGTRTLSQILPQEDKWAANYGKTVVGLSLEQAQFANLSGEKASEVVNTILARSGIGSIDELYIIAGTVSYSDGTQVCMNFEIMQCELGCFLVTIDGSST